ncbi:hypothetical protein ENBRE01_1229 [Enteropsectra breve]|nr:hypothetical protein ENBRE01_1229 [Enteropsectra breve]
MVYLSSLFLGFSSGASSKRPFLNRIWLVSFFIGSAFGDDIDNTSTDAGTCVNSMWIGLNDSKQSNKGYSEQNQSISPPNDKETASPAKSQSCTPESNSSQNLALSGDNSVSADFVKIDNPLPFATIELENGFSYGLHKSIKQGSLHACAIHFAVIIVYGSYEDLMSLEKLINKSNLEINLDLMIYALYKTGLIHGDKSSDIEYSLTMDIMDEHIPEFKDTITIEHIKDGLLDLVRADISGKDIKEKQALKKKLENILDFLEKNDPTSESIKNLEIKAISSDDLPYFMLPLSAFESPALILNFTQKIVSDKSYADCVAELLFSRLESCKHFPLVKKLCFKLICGFYKMHPREANRRVIRYLEEGGCRGLSYIRTCCGIQ